MEKHKRLYNHVIIIDDSINDLRHLKNTLISVNYASHITCFENYKIASQYIRHCKDCPDLVFLNMTELRDLELIDCFLKEFIHSIKVVITSSFKNIQDQKSSIIYPDIIKFPLKPIKETDLTRGMESLGEV